MPPPAMSPSDDGERIVRLETLFEVHMAEQRAANTEAREHRRNMATCQQVTDKRLSRVEDVVCGDKDSGRLSIGERVANIEKVVLTAEISWRTIAKMGAIATFITGGVAWGYHQVVDFLKVH
jgi:hypothetical protein